MKPLHRLLCAVLALTVCLLPAAGSAATLLSLAGSTPLSGAVAPIYTEAQNNANTLYLALDDSSSTNWNYIGWSTLSRDNIPEAAFYFNSETIGSVWLRAGNYTSQNAYWEYAFPQRVTLRVITGGQYYSDYTWEMDDYYDTVTVSDSWVNGYQRLQLPTVHTDVTCIQLFIPTWRSGTSYANQVAVSDILFTTDNGSPSGNGGTSTGSRTTPPPSWSWGSPISATLSMRLATRSGPSTKYTELGSYFKAGDPITVISKAYDKGNDIWWLQVEFSYSGTPRRAYTGLKRVNVDIDRVEEEISLGSGTVLRSAAAYWGPGTKYSRYDKPVSQGKTGTVWAEENGFVQFEYKNSAGTLVRVWLDADDVSW